MRSSVFGAGLFFCGVFAVAGALAACASGADTDSGDNSGSPTPNQQNQGNDSSVDEAGSGDEIPTSSYGDGGTGTTGDEPPATEDSGLDGGEEAAAVGPTCTTGQTCVDIVPSGWTGYVQLVLQNGDAGAACAAPYATPQPQLAGETDVDGGPATCAPCTCGIPDSGPITCAVDLGGGSCPGTSNATVLAQGACVANPFFFAANGLVEAPTVTSHTGACPPAQGGEQTTPPPPATSTFATVCASSAAGDAGVSTGASEAGAAMACQTTQACAAFPAQDDGGAPSGVCIYQSGVQDCPTGVIFTAQYVVGPVSDTRACSCSCGAACPGDGYVELYSSSSCSGSPTGSIDVNTPCPSSTPTASAFKYFPTTGTWNGACQAVDAGPTGSVSIDGGAATTFCCVP
jgi:hypothetical protein